MAEIEPVSAPHRKSSTEIYSYVCVNILLIVVGYTTNMKFLLKTKQLHKKGGLLNDVVACCMCLSVFNLLHLSDIIPKTVYFINPNSLNFSGNSTERLCDMLLLVSYFSKFGVYYFLFAIARECFSLSRNESASFGHTGIRMVLEGTSVWTIHALILWHFISEGPNGLRMYSNQCLFSRLMTEYTDFVISLMFVAMFFLALWAGVEMKEWGKGYAIGTPILRQSRGAFLLYFACWLPSFVTEMLIFSRVLASKNEDGSNRIFQELLRQLVYGGSACFPLVWNCLEKKSCPRPLQVDTKTSKLSNV